MKSVFGKFIVWGIYIAVTQYGVKFACLNDTMFQKVCHYQNRMATSFAYAIHPMEIAASRTTGIPTHSLMRDRLLYKPAELFDKIKAPLPDIFDEKKRK